MRSCPGFKLPPTGSHNRAGSVWAQFEKTGSLPRRTSRAITGYLNEEAVATAMTRPIGEVLFVGWVATKPSSQRRGCAEALMRHALTHSGRRPGELRSVLHATPAGLPLYERLWYRRCCSVPACTLAEASRNHDGATEPYGCWVA
jgi:GNAT superfamily N-acetyltransferase